MRTFLAAAISGLLFSACSPKDPMDGRVLLQFKPMNESKVKMHYDFTINSPTTGNNTAFKMELSGMVAGGEGQNTFVTLTNNKITMEGAIEGQKVMLVAGQPDSMSTELKMVVAGVFSQLNKTFITEFDGKLNKLSEEVRDDTSGSEKTENKMQFFIRYPDSAVKAGDTWKKDLIIKSGNKMNCSATYTLKEVNDSSAVISFEGILTGEGETFGHPFSIEGKLNGQSLVDPVTGWPLNTEVNQEFTLSVQEKKIIMQYEIRHKIIIE